MEINFKQLIKLPGFEKFDKWDIEPNPFRMFKCKVLRNDDPNWFISSLILSNNPIGTILPRHLGGAAGSSIYLEESITSCICEGFERYSSTNYFMKDTPYMRLVDYSKGYIRCADEENAPASFKFKGITVPIEHAKVFRLTDDTPDFLPYELVHLGISKSDINYLFSSPISTGCAFQTKKERALKRGLEEVIERHALMLWWYATDRNEKVIDLSCCTDFDIHERIERIRIKGIRIRIFEISPIQGFPVVFCMLQSDKFPFFSCGASCNTDIRHAIIKSLDEAISIRYMSEFIGRRQINTYDFGWVKTLEDHMVLYANWKDSPIINTIMNKNSNTVLMTDYNMPVRLETMDDLRTTAVRLHQEGFDVYYKDLTLDEVRPIGMVYRVMIPQMMPLTQYDNVRWLSALLTDGRTISDINPYPQPFS